ADSCGSADLKMTVLVAGPMNGAGMERGSVPSSSPPPNPREARCEHHLDNGRDDDARADSSCSELEKPQTREQCARSTDAKTHRRPKVRRRGRSSEEEHQREAEVESAKPTTNDERTLGRLDAPLVQHRSPSEDEAETENAAGHGHEVRHDSE